MLLLGFGFVAGVVAGGYVGYRFGKWRGSKAKPKKGLPTMEAMLANVYPQARDEQLAADVDFDIEQRIREA